MRISDWSSDVCSSDLFGVRETLHQLLDHQPALHADQIRADAEMRAGTEHDVAVETAFDIQLHRVFPFRGIDPGSGEVEQDRLAFPEVLTTPFEVFGNDTELRRLAERAHAQKLDDRVLHPLRLFAQPRAMLRIAKQPLDR